ncbi:MAG: hypothetical protein EOP04_04055 [Proteobacteria bacterium]|nr:MAG: hypothetical protein EOP04_04055 [Pseudomonadota bacterium]
MEKFVPKEQYLRVPKACTVHHHQLFAIDPLSSENDPGGIGTMNWFEGDLFRAMFGNRISFDLVWYPECDPKGSFIFEVIADREWEKPLRYYSTTSRNDLIAKLESELYYASTLGSDSYIALPIEPSLIKSQLAPVSTLTGFLVKENELFEDEALNFIPGQNKLLVHFSSPERLDLTVCSIDEDSSKRYELRVYLAGDLTNAIDAISLLSIDQINSRIDYEKGLYGKWGGGTHYLYHKRKEIEARSKYSL